MVADVASALGSWGTVVLAAVAVIGVLFSMFRWTNRHVAEPLKEVAVIRTTQMEFVKTVNSIKSELHPNHGSSMRDSIDRNEAITNETADKLRELTTTVAVHVAEDTAHWEDIGVSLNKLEEGQALAAEAALAVKKRLDKREKK